MTGVRLRTVVPLQRQLSGGRIFNFELTSALRRRGWQVDERTVAADWPWPLPEERRAVRAALTASPTQPVLVDGLVGSACPLEIEAVVAAGVDVILLVHLPLPAETGLTNRQRTQLTRLERHAVAAATVVATTSHWAAADLKRRYGLTEVRVLLPGVDTAPLATGSDPPLLIMAAALTPVKNHATVLAALDLIRDLPWQAVLVGAHRHDRTVRAVRHHVRTAAHSSRIRLPGELRGEALDRVWRDSDLLLVPSWTETYGLVVAEALARGIPAVVSRSTGAVEALTGSPAPSRPADGKPSPGLDTLAGALANPADPHEWAQTLRTWLNDPALRERWRSNALRRRAELRTWADTAADFDTLLRMLA